MIQKVVLGMTRFFSEKTGKNTKQQGEKEKIRQPPPKKKLGIFREKVCLETCWKKRCFLLQNVIFSKYSKEFTT